MAIENLTLKDAVTAAMTFAVSLQGQDARVSADSILAYIEANITTTADKVTQYAAPLTGTTVTLTDDQTGVWLILTPAGTIAALTLKLPALANTLDGQEVLVNCTQIVTTLTIDGNGATVTGAPTALTANGFFRLRFDDVVNVWYRVG
jgi:hypothetical protein